MVNIGIAGIPKMYPGQKVTVVNNSNITTDKKPYIETDTVGQGYTDSTGTLPPTLLSPPPGSASGAVILVNPPPNPYQGILPRHNTPSGPAEQGGKVMMALTSGVFIPVVQFTPPEVQP